MSPEFIYEIAPGGLLPDNKSFGVFWMNREALAAAAGMTGAFNQVSLSILPNADLEILIRQIDEELDVYGGLGAIARKDQRSIDSSRAKWTSFAIWVSSPRPSSCAWLRS